MKISVTKADIAAGKSTITGNPACLAIRRQAGWHGARLDCGGFFHLYNGFTREWTLTVCSPMVLRRIARFIDGKTVAPFSFNIPAIGKIQ